MPGMSQSLNKWQLLLLFAILIIPENSAELFQILPILTKSKRIFNFLAALDHHRLYIKYMTGLDTWNEPLHCVSIQLGMWEDLQCSCLLMCCYVYKEFLPAVSAMAFRSPQMHAHFLQVQNRSYFLIVGYQRTIILG